MFQFVLNDIKDIFDSSQVDSRRIIRGPTWGVDMLTKKEKSDMYCMLVH